MGNKTINFCIVFFLLVICYSCEKEEYYSCNPKADQWVKNNLSEVHLMTRKEWINIDDEIIQKAVYNAFTTEQRHNLWISKFKEVLLLELNNDERNHLSLMSDEVKANPQWFDDKLNLEYRDQMDLFIYEWADVARDSLGWTDLDFYLLIGTAEVIEKKLNGGFAKVASMYSSKVQTRGEGEGEGYGNICDCGTDSEYFFLCPALDNYECKVTNECTITEKGCGAWQMNTCWGECSKVRI